MSAPAAATATLAGRYEALRARIAAAGDQGVTVIAVTKALRAWAIEAAAACGIGDIGENYAQECVAKIAEVSALPRPRVPLHRPAPAQQGQGAGRLRRRLADRRPGRAGPRDWPAGPRVGGDDPGEHLG